MSRRVEVERGGSVVSGSTVTCATALCLVHHAVPLVRRAEKLAPGSDCDEPLACGAQALGHGDAIAILPSALVRVLADGFEVNFLAATRQRI
jgi:hypothetical protein